MDWDLDGKLDIISGCYWTDGANAGQIQILKGTGGIDFAVSESIVNAAGEPLENMQLEKGDNQNQIETICTQQHAVDYDGDGDLDLVVGCFGSNFYYYENTADASSVPALASPVKLDIVSPHQHAAPHFADWDADGDLDLLSGTASGGVLFAENVGSRKEPKYAEFIELLAPVGYSGGDSDTIAQGTRVWATDYNGDGLLDLLVGDSSSITKRVAGLSDEAFEKLKTEAGEKMTAASERMQKFQEEHAEKFEAMAQGEEPDAEFRKEMQEVSAEMSAAYESQGKFQTSTSTGFVWLLVRKPDTNSLASSQ